MDELFIKGGPLMWPLLACSVLSVAVTIERAIFWVREKMRIDPALIDKIFGHTEKGEFETAVNLGKGTSFTDARVLLSGLAHRDYGLRGSMEVAAQDEIDRMKRGLAILDTIITMAPLLGILGTVLGIIESFDLLGVGGIEDPRAVTGGIAQALITTAAGLSVAIVTLVPFNYMVTKVERATKRLDGLLTSFELAYKRGADAVK